MSNNDGHALSFSIVSQQVLTKVVCPHDGKPFDYYEEAPLCRRQGEDGQPGVGPYLVDDCAVAEQYEAIGEEALYVTPSGIAEREIPVTVLPMPIIWWWEIGDGIFIEPIRPPEKKS